MEPINIDSIVIKEGEKIKIPQKTDCYKAKSGRFICSKTNSYLVKGYKELPKNAEYVLFPNYRKHQGWINYGEHIFYDKEGNILK